MQCTPERFTANTPGYLGFLLIGAAFIALVGGIYLAAVEILSSEGMAVSSLSSFGSIGLS